MKNRTGELWQDIHTGRFFIVIYTVLVNSRQKAATHSVLITKNESKTSLLYAYETETFITKWEDCFQLERIQ